ncbi:hypothetical protein ACWCXB_34895 [Streptomyces sp. NPDC001514]
MTTVVGMVCDHGERGPSLEMALTRIRRTAPRARLVLLSAVLPNGGDIAHWLDPAAQGANHAKFDWSPSQLRTGVFSWWGQETHGRAAASSTAPPAESTSSYRRC